MKEGTKITIRGVPETLKRAMDMRAGRQRRSRQKLLLDVLHSEFWLEEMAIRKSMEDVPQDS
jgi:plasmid stability protein